MKMPISANYKKPTQLLKALSETSKLMIENKDLNTIINPILAILGKTANVDRTYIFKNIFQNGEPMNLNYEYEWCKKGIDPHLLNPELQNVLWSSYGTLKDFLSLGKVYFEHTHNITEKALAESFVMQNIKSVIFMPIFTGNQFWGFIGFDDCEMERIWDENEIFTIASIASNLGVFMLNAQLENELDKKKAEIEQQSLFYENILHSLPADIVLFDKEQRYLFVNKNGIPNKETREWIIGKTDLAYCEHENKPKNIAESRKANFNTVKTTLQSLTTEETFEVNGETKHYLRILHPVFNSNNSIEYIVGYGLDITELKLKEDVIRKQHHAIENSPVGIALINKEGNYYYMNKANAQVFDYDPFELLNKSWKTIYNQNEIEKIEKEYYPELIKNGSWNGETIGVSKYGKKVYQEISLSIFSDGEQVCITRDMTKPKEELNKVQQINTQLELAMKVSNLGMWTIELKSRKMTMNEATYHILKLNKQVTKNITIEKWGDAIHPDDKERVRNETVNHIENYHLRPENTYRIEYRIRQKDGNYIWVLVIGKISKTNDAGMPAEMTGFILDINTKKLYDEKVNQSDKRYRDLVESLNEIIFQTDIEGNWKFLNQSWEAITGFDTNYTLNKNIVSFVYDDDKYKTMTHFKKLVSGNLLETSDVIRFVNKNKDIVWFDFHASLLKDNTGKNIGVVGSAENITARIEAETELEKNKEILNKIVSSIDDIIWSFDIEKKSLSYISSSCLAMTGIPDSDYYNGKYDWYDMVSPDYLELVKKSDFDLFKNRIKERDIIYKIKFHNKTKTKWVRNRAKLCTNENGEPIRVDGVTLDITNLVLAEQKLKLSEEKYRLISENIQDIITILDTDGNVQYMSPSATKLSGYSDTHLLKNNMLSIVHPDFVKSVHTFLKEAIEPNEHNKILFKAINANNDFIWLESIVTVLHNTGNKTLLQASTRDVTPRVNAELELTKALAKEKELHELKSRFINMASHEFRTPLATIKSSTELIKLFIDKDRNGLSSIIYNKVNDKISDIIVDIDSISELMTDILTMGKIEARKTPYNPKPTNLNEFVKEYLKTDAIKILKNRTINYTESDCNKMTLIDEKIMKQVLENAISNAVKYSENDLPVEIAITTKKNKKVITITDKGMGIPEQEIPFVFESFFRSSNVNNIPGTGLGMAIIKLFIEMHGGDVTLKSKLNKGTSLIISLPFLTNSNQ